MQKDQEQADVGAPQSTKKPVILVDGSSYLFRAYHALPPLVTAKGQPTGALYGVINMLRRLINEYHPDYLAVVFDPKGKTLRHEWYEPYKANRPSMPDELQQQIAPLHEMIKAMGIPLLIMPGIEADDVIGSLAQHIVEKKHSVLISTGDKDFAQLVVDGEIKLINTMSQQVLDEEGVKQKFGVPPEKITDYLALIGDAIDNVPGVTKVGPKTAVKWLTEYGSLENIMRSADKVPGKIGENLREALPKLPLSKRLVTIVTDIELPLDFHALRYRGIEDHEKFKQLCQEFEFHSLLADLQKATIDKKILQNKTLTEVAEPLLPVVEQQLPLAAEKPGNYTAILEEKDFLTWLERLKNAAVIAFDTETTDLDPWRADWVGMSLCVQGGEAVYIPFMHDYPGAPQQLARDWVVQQLQPIFQNPQVLLVGQNLKYDLAIALRHGLLTKTKLFDTLLAAYVLNNSDFVRRDLSALAKHYLARILIDYEMVAGKGQKQVKFNAVPVQDAAAYGAQDADVAWLLWEKFHSALKNHTKSQNIFSDIEMPLMQVLLRMEQHGVLLDAEMLQQQSKTLQQRVVQLREQIMQLAGVDFNLDSPKQLQEVLFERLKLPSTKKTTTGQLSTAESVLQNLAVHYPIPKLILEYRSLMKLKTTYTDKLPQQINPQTGRVHTSYNQAITVTGRLSSNNPNLQNIPARSEEGRKIRAAFIAPQGYRIVSADYSQIELRIMAHFSQDPGLIAAFNQHLDVHRATAAEVFGVALEAVTPELRRRAKTINFGLIYGMSAFGLAQQLGVSRHEAQAYMDVYFQRYPGVKTFMQSICQLARKQGYVETFFGRRLWMPDILSKEAGRRQAAERAVINAPLQGTAADIIKRAMIQLDRWLQQADIRAHMVMQVHDELVFEVAATDVDSALPVIEKHMIEAAQLLIPLQVSIGHGTNWGQAHE